MKITPRAARSTGPIVNKTKLPGRRAPRSRGDHPRNHLPANVANIPLPAGLTPDQVTIVESGERWISRSKGVTQNYLETE